MRSLLPVQGSKIHTGKSLHEQSHGESFFAAFMHRFGSRGLYILDEPEAALSPLRQMSLLVRMHELVRSESQFVIATHSPILMSYPGADVGCWKRKASGKQPWRKRNITQ